MSVHHQNLKSLAKKILVAKGFDESQIFEEVPVFVAGAKVNVVGKFDPEVGAIIKAKKSVIADVVAFKDDYAVVVECGNTPSERLAQFNLVFDEVIYLPFVEIFKEIADVNRLNSQVSELKSEKGKLEAENLTLKQKISTIKEQLHDLIQQK